MQATGLKPNWVEIENQAALLEKKDIGPFKPSLINIAISVLKQNWDQYASAFTRENKNVLHIKVVMDITIRCLIGDRGQIYIIHKGDKSPKVASGINRCIRYGLCLNKMQLTAVKISKKSCEDLRGWLHEVRMFESKLVKDNPLFVQMKDYCTYSSKKNASVQKLAIVTEWCNLKDALEALESRKISNSEFFQLIPFCFQILLELNKYKTLHRDIKLENTFVHRNEDGSLTFKLGDFGSGNTQEDELIFLNKNDAFLGGTSSCMSPEVLHFNSRYSAYMQPYSELIEKVCSLKTDVWTMGMLLFNVLYGSFKFPSNREDLEKLTQFDVNRILDDCFESGFWCSSSMDPTTKENLFQCIRGMLQIEPEKRLTGPQLFEMYNKKFFY